MRPQKRLVEGHKLRTSEFPAWILTSSIIGSNAVCHTSERLYVTQKVALSFFYRIYSQLEQPVLHDSGMDAVVKFTNQSQGRDRMFR